MMDAPAAEAPHQEAGSGAVNSQVPIIFALLTGAMIFLQKLGLATGTGAVGLDTVLLWCGFGWLALRGELRIVPHRLVLLILLLNAIALSILLGERSVKAAALGVVLVMYVGFVFQVRVSDATVTRCLDIFQRCMTWIAIIVLMQQVLQYTVGHRFWPDLDAIIPTKLQYPGFAYIHPYSWRSPYLEPNGVVFLEPSALSYYLVAAFILEIVRFKRPARTVLLLAAMLAGLAGTGPTALLLTTPIWLPRIGGRLAGALLVIGAPLLLIALATGFLDPLLHRSGELSNNQSSGYARIIDPLSSIAETLRQPGIVLSGHGPGSSPKSHDLVQWPFSKLLYEYGLATAVLFHLYLLTSLFDTPPSRTLSAVLLVPYLFFGGGFVSHASVMPLVLLGSLLAARPPPERRTKAWPASRVPTAIPTRYAP